MRMGRASLAVVLVVVAGCTSGSQRSAPTTTVPTTGLVTGRMHITDGPRPELDNSLPGVVEVHHRFKATVLIRVRVGRTGRFRIALPVGTCSAYPCPNTTRTGSFPHASVDLDPERADWSLALVRPCCGSIDASIANGGYEARVGTTRASAVAAASR
jgi:hypothetical protein